jgi:4-alpha-glucanotransferase
MELSPQHKLAGILAPLFALRGPNDLGVGDIGALRDLVDWAADAGLGRKLYPNSPVTALLQKWLAYFRTEYPAVRWITQKLSL